MLLGAGVPLLGACGGDDDDGAVTDAIEDGLEPEAGPLRIFNYADYVNPDTVAAFEEQYGVKVEITTFDVDAEAITKLANGSVEVDVFNSAAPNTLGRLIAGGILQPLNKSYLPNFANLLPSFIDPWYDKGSKYTVPYTVFSSGIAYRTDRIEPAKVDEMGWDILWDPTYKGVTSILDDYREGIAMALLRKGITDVNTTDEALIDTGRRRPLRTGRPDEHQGQHRGLQGHPRGCHRPGPHLERRHAGRRLLVPAGGHRPVGARLVVPGRRGRRGQQRLHDRHRQRQEPGARPPVRSTSCSTPPTPRRTSAGTATCRRSRASTPTT